MCCFRQYQVESRSLALADVHPSDDQFRKDVYARLDKLAQMSEQHAKHGGASLNGTATASTAASGTGSVAHVACARTR